MTTTRVDSSERRGSGPVKWLDDRIGLAGLTKKNVRKVFPDHWSFMLGEIALWSFVILLITGTFLTFWYKPSMGEVTYTGSYARLRGLQMTEAYESTLKLSFDVRGGLLMRQIHHWAANLFLASMTIHMLRVFFTGAFRKPRELNWLVGLGLLMLGIVEGFAGYSLPDDLLSGIGLRIAEGIMRAIPVAGSYISYLAFGGEFPGTSLVPRLFILHVLLIPGILLGLITAHMLLLVYHKHTQWAGPGRTERNVVGLPMMPVYMAKAGGFFFIVFGVSSVMGALVQINPIWLYGPYTPEQVTADSQPDWYMGWLDGGLRIMPNWETRIHGFVISWNILVPGVMLLGILFTLLAAYPFVEAWITGDRREHHLLQRPRNAPTRTGLGVAGMTAYGLLWTGAGTDLIATHFHMSIYAIIWFLRFAIFVGPVLAFILTRRWCISLQRHDVESLLHGYESGVIVRSPTGGYSEVHRPLSPERAYTLTAHDDDEPLTLPPAEDGNAIPRRIPRKERLRVRLSEFWYGDTVRRPTRRQLEDAHHHAELESHEEIVETSEPGGRTLESSVD